MWHKMLGIRIGHPLMFSFPRPYFGCKNRRHVDLTQDTEKQKIRPAEVVHQAIENYKVVIFSKRNCVYCDLAKEQFRKLKVPAHIVELDGRNDANEIRNVLAQLTGRRLLPRCFIDGKFIGGGTAVKQLEQLGILQKYLSSKIE